MVDLFTIHRVRQSNAETTILENLAQHRILVIQIQRQRHRAIPTIDPVIDLVATSLLIRHEQRVVRQIDVARLHIHLAIDRLQIDRLNVVDVEGVSEQGMLIDFSDVSQILNEYIHDIIDHAFVVYDKDEVLLEMFKLLPPGHRIVKVPFIPTAENLAKWAFEQVSPHIKTAYGNKLRLTAMHVRETPKSWACWKE